MNLSKESRDYWKAVDQLSLETMRRFIDELGELPERLDREKLTKSQTAREKQ